MIRRYWLVVLAVVLVVIGGYVVVDRKREMRSATQVDLRSRLDIGSFGRQQSCARLPRFLGHMGITQPILIDLSQKRYTGVAMLYGRDLRRVYHPRSWTRYGHMGTYTLDQNGTLYLAPMPFISIRSDTFALQKSIYYIDTITGQLQKWMSIDEVTATPSDPYGIVSLVYDCDDHSLWVGAIDGSTYDTARGRIYHIDIATRRILQRYRGIDPLSLQILHTSLGKYLMAGSAKDGGLYVFDIGDGSIDSTPVLALDLESFDEHIRKIRIIGNNLIRIETIPFSYTLITRTASHDRAVYDYRWIPLEDHWQKISQTPKTK